MPPLIYDDLVLIGPAGAEFAGKGWVGAFRLSNGEPVWKFNTVPDPGEPGAETWCGDPNTLKHGGNLWTPMSLDVERGCCMCRWAIQRRTSMTRVAQARTSTPTRSSRWMFAQASWPDTTKRSRTMCAITT
jgi:hypothetical protein